MLSTEVVRNIAGRLHTGIDHVRTVVGIEPPEAKAQRFHVVADQIADDIGVFEKLGPVTMGAGDEIIQRVAVHLYHIIDPLFREPNPTVLGTESRPIDRELRNFLERNTLNLAPQALTLGIPLGSVEYEYNVVMDQAARVAMVLLRDDVREQGQGSLFASRVIARYRSVKGPSLGLPIWTLSSSIDARLGNSLEIFGSRIRDLRLSVREEQEKRFASSQ